MHSLDLTLAAILSIEVAGYALVLFGRTGKARSRAYGDLGWIRPEDGDIQIKQSVNLTAIGAASGLSSGMLMGALVGLLVLNPLGGMALGGVVGAASGAVSGSLADYGINDEFIRELGEPIAPGTSALFVLVTKVTPDKVIDEIREHNPRVLRTSLSTAQENALREALAKVV